MATQIYSKKTNAELIALTDDVVANKALFDARVIAVDASLGEFRADFSAEQAVRDSEKAELDASLSAVNALVSSNKAELDASMNAVNALVASNKAELDASMNAVNALVASNKAELDACLNDVREEAIQNLNDLDAYFENKHNAVDSALTDVNGRVDALIASSTADNNAVVSRVAELERITGDDLKDTVNSVLNEQIIQQTLDAYLATDSELSTAVNYAVADRVNVDTEIKAKFDLLVDTLFAGLTFEGVEKTDLKFGADVVEFDGMIKDEHIGYWFGNKYKIHSITEATDTEPQKISLKWDMNMLGGEGSIASMWEIPFDPATKTYTQVDYGLNAVKFELIDGVLYFAGLPQTN